MQYLWILFWITELFLAFHLVNWIRLLLVLMLTFCFLVPIYWLWHCLHIESIAYFGFFLTANYMLCTLSGHSNIWGLTGFWIHWNSCRFQQIEQPPLKSQTIQISPLSCCVKSTVLHNMYVLSEMFSWTTLHKIFAYVYKSITFLLASLWWW